jgi:hypothetical protein
MSANKKRSVNVKVLTHHHTMTAAFDPSSSGVPKDKYCGSSSTGRLAS